AAAVAAVAAADVDGPKTPAFDREFSASAGKTRFWQDGQALFFFCFSSLSYSFYPPGSPSPLECCERRPTNSPLFVALCNLIFVGPSVHLGMTTIHTDMSSYARHCMSQVASIPPFDGIEWIWLPYRTLFERTSKPTCLRCMPLSYTHIAHAYISFLSFFTPEKSSKTPP
ncbi:hypothetical protein L249_0412, partial [Ophiocordyceps polyrhachis-furcata BCC 54312]